MSNLIDSTTTILGYFLDWFSSFTTFLIANPFILILLGICITIILFTLIYDLYTVTMTKKAFKYMKKPDSDSKWEKWI